MPRSVALIVNPSAGGGRAERILPDVEASLRRRGMHARTERTTSIEHAAELARAAAAEGEIAGALGGDGLIGTVAGALRDTGGVLGILPGGRGNDFARVLGIPADPAGAVEVLANGEERSLDLGEAGGRAFCCIASCGFDSVANRIANDARLVRGNLVYLYAALRALAGWRPATFTVEVDGERETFSGYSVAVANSKAYGGGMFVAPQAELDDGALDVVTVSHVGRLRFLASFPQVFKGTHLERAEVSSRRGHEVRVSADRPFTVYADGDPIGELPLTVRVLPHAVRAILPR
ncbi:MAG: diacylglycerol kinase family protein [Solirubrobacteraceae bacterium]